MRAKRTNSQVRAQQILDEAYKIAAASPFGLLHQLKRKKLAQQLGVTEAAIWKYYNFDDLRVEIVKLGVLNNNELIIRQAKADPYLSTFISM